MLARTITLLLAVGSHQAATVPQPAPGPSGRATARPDAPGFVHIYWPEQQRGGKRQKVTCNGVKVADLQNNRYVTLTVPAGTYNLAFRNHQVAAVVESGGEYHYRASIEGHFQFSMGATLRLMSGDEAVNEMRRQSVTPNDSRRTFTTACVATTPGRQRQ